MKLSMVLISLFFLGPVSLQAKVKNIILLIGDGMGPQQMALGELYLRYGNVKDWPRKTMAFSDPQNPPHLALSYTEPHGNIVVDSACSATQLATGKKGGPEMIGLDRQGDIVKTVVELAKAKGKATGLVSDTRITYATPASFIAHRAHRSMENEIAEDIIKGEVDVLLSGGYRYFLPQDISDEKSEAHKKWKARLPQNFSLKSTRNDHKDLLSIAEARGDQVIFSNSELAQIKKGKVLGLFGESAMPDAITMKEMEQEKSRVIPTLEEMSVKAIELLAQNPKGFFLMIEGGQIDWAGHANDAGWMLAEMLRFDLAVQAALDFAAKNPDETLVLVTADHETGSFGFSYSSLNIPAPSKLPGEGFKGIEFKVKNNFGQYQQIEKLGKQTGLLSTAVEDFLKASPKATNGVKLCQEVYAISELKLTNPECEQLLKDYRAISAKSPGPLSHKIFEAYSLEEDLLANLIGRALSPKQNLVWGTGTHTSTPVAVLSWGPEKAREKLSGFLHPSQVGAILQEML